MGFGVGSTPSQFVPDRCQCFTSLYVLYKCSEVDVAGNDSMWLKSQVPALGKVEAGGLDA